jgi:hypothetical protein
MKQAWDLRQEFHTHAEIARILQVSRKCVSAMLWTIEKRVLAELVREVAAVKACHTAQLQRVAAEAFTAWIRSKEDTETMRTRTKTVPGTAAAEVKETITEHTSRNQPGTPSLLAESRAALAEIRKLWGIDSKSTAHSDEELVQADLAELRINAALALKQEEEKDCSR